MNHDIAAIYVSVSRDLLPKWIPPDMTESLMSANELNLLTAVWWANEMIKNLCHTK